MVRTSPWSPRRRPVFINVDAAHIVITCHGNFHHACTGFTGHFNFRQVFLCFLHALLHLLRLLHDISHSTFKHGRLSHYLLIVCHYRG